MSVLLLRHHNKVIYHDTRVFSVIRGAKCLCMDASYLFIYCSVLYCCILPATVSECLQKRLEVKCILYKKGLTIQSAAGMFISREWHYWLKPGAVALARDERQVH